MTAPRLTEVVPAPRWTTRRGLDTAGARWAVLPWWARALLVFALARIGTTLALLWLSTLTTAASRAGLHPSFLHISAIWDGDWYGAVAAHGYPLVLPRSASGAVQQNAWAFLPVYPVLTGVLARVLEVPWEAVAVAVSVLAGAGSALVLRTLLTPRVGASAADFAVVLYACSPLSFVLQTTYADSLGLLLLFSALLLVERHRYGAALPVVVLLGFTRPGVLALALAIGLHLLRRVAAAARGQQPFPSGERGAAVALVATAVGVGFAWPLIAALVTRVPDAYFATEGAWRLWVMGHTNITFVQPWIVVAHLAFGSPLGDVVLIALIVAFVALLCSPRVRRLGPDLVGYLAAYAAYLLAVFLPQTSAFRLLMPMAPLAGSIATVESRWFRVGAVTLFLVLQMVWLTITYGPVTGWWSVP